MKKKEEIVFEQVFLTCPECGGVQKITGDHIDEEGLFVLHTSCKSCETEWQHTISTVEI